MLRVGGGGAVFIVSVEQVLGVNGTKRIGKLGLDSIQLQKQ